MKTRSKILLIAMALFVVSASSVFAKGNPTLFGITGGVNMSNETGDVTDNAMKIGFNAGVLVNLGINDTWSIVPGVLYSLKGTQSSANSSDKENLTYLEIPVDAEYKLSSGLNFFAGPYLGILMTAKETDGTNTVDIKSDVKSTDFGLNFGVGYDLGMGLGFRAQYELGLSNDVNTSGSTASIKNSNIAINVLYWFGSK